LIYINIILKNSLKKKKTDLKYITTLLNESLPFLAIFKAEIAIVFAVNIEHCLD